MPRRTMTYNSIGIHQTRIKDSNFILDSVQGINVLDEFERWCRGVSTGHFVEPTKHRYGKKPEVERRNRLVLATMRTGHFGSDGNQVVDTSNHTTSYETRSVDAQTIETRCALLIPPNSKTGLFFIERQGHEGCGSRILDSFKAHLTELAKLKMNARGRPLNIVVDDHAIVAGDAWLEMANMRSVTAVQFEMSTDIADEGGPRPVALEYRRMLSAVKGTSWLPTRIRDLIMRNGVRAASMIGFPDDGDYDELIIELGDGERSKTMVIGREKTPAIRRLLNDDGQPSLKVSAFIDRIDEEARDFYTERRLSWDYVWTRKPAQANHSSS